MSRAMQNPYFLAIESAADKTLLNLEEVLDNLAFNRDGLVPVITQDAVSKDVLMFAWMNRESLNLTIQSGQMTYWSRSRQQLWKKGETSGNRQALVSMSFDCDGDCILCLVEQIGPACHTGRPNCFYLKVNGIEKSVMVKGDRPKR